MSLGGTAVAAMLGVGQAPVSATGTKRSISDSMVVVVVVGLVGVVVVVVVVVVGLVVVGSS